MLSYNVASNFDIDRLHLVEHTANSHLRDHHVARAALHDVLAHSNMCPVLINAPTMALPNPLCCDYDRHPDFAA